MDNLPVGPPAKVRRWLYTVLLILVLLAAAWLRLWRLPSLPPGFWYDEAYNSMEGLWMRDTFTVVAYFVGDMGREVLMSCLLTASMAVWGVSPLACRLVNPLLAMLLLALTHRWLLCLFATDRDRRWLALAATAGLAFSFWHVVMSRTAYEAPLVPLFLVAMLLLFWRGWQEATAARSNALEVPADPSVILPHKKRLGARRWRYFVGAGLAMGLGVYSYEAGRLAPLILWLFAVMWTVLARRHRKNATFSVQPIRTLWSGVLVVSLTTLVVLVPLCLFILDHPDLFVARALDVFILNRVARGETTLGDQLLSALSVFWGNSSFTWRHNIPGASGFDWLSRIGFWIGLPVAISRRRQPNYLLLVICLGVTWLPALLSQGLSTMRLSGMLPIYYAVAAVGWLALANAFARLVSRVVKSRPCPRARLVTSADLPFRGIVLGTLLAATVIVGGVGTAYNYFVRWAAAPGVYRDYEGQLADMARFISTETYTTDVLLPFSVYTHPSARFLLHEEFRESSSPPARTRRRPVVIMRPPGTESSAMVWMTRDQAGAGQVYVTRAMPPDLFTAQTALAAETPLQVPASSDEPIASLSYLADWDSLRAQLTDWSTIAVTDLDWDHELVLGGYEVWPRVVQPGQPVTLTLYWRGRVGRPLAYHVFVQLVDGRGEAIAQWTDHALSDQHRWRPGGLVPDQHILWLGTEIAPGPYLARIGLFNPTTERRASILSTTGQPVGDQIALGLFYVADSGGDPRRPDNTLRARLGDSIDLQGFSLTSRDSSSSDSRLLRVRLHWQASARILHDYTTFVQLLDAEGRRVAGWDAQPLSGQYPTSHWQPGDVIVDTLEVPLPGDLAAGEYRLVTGMYDLATGKRLPAVDDAGRPLPDDMITLTRQVVP